MINTPDHQSSADRVEPECNADALRQEILGEINRLHRFSTRGIWALSLFLLVSIIAWYEFPFLPTPDAVITILGKPPTASIVSIALLLYTFSAVILSLSRMATGIEHHSSFCHVGYLSVFFLFYYFGKALTDNYWAVVGAGITILGVESYRIWIFCAETVTQKQEDLDFINRTGRPPPSNLS